MTSNVTVITPTTGKDSLFTLIESLKNQKHHDGHFLRVNHIMLWDSMREGKFLFPEGEDNKLLDIKSLEICTESYQSVCIELPWKTKIGSAPGSALRAIGLMAAPTDVEWVTFADDDIIWELNHLDSLLEVLDVTSAKWGFCMRHIWHELPNGQYEYICLDDFESVGEAAKTPYKMVDNNCMIFKRRFGSSASPLYRETTEYNDDRHMYNFLSEHAGPPATTGWGTINQVCPDRLVEFFRKNGDRSKLGKI